MESDLKILEVETVEPLAPVAEIPQRSSCDQGCSDTHEDSLQNIKHLAQHEQRVQERIVKAHSSLYSSSESSGAVGASQETGLISSRDMEGDVSRKIYDKPDHKCEDCIVLQGGEKSICSRNLNVSLSDLNTPKSVLEFLDKNKWRNCPYCLASIPTENLPVHLIFSHGDVYDILDQLTERGQEECEDCQIKLASRWEVIRHKVVNCKSRERNVREILTKIPMEKLNGGKDNRDRLVIRLYRDMVINNKGLTKHAVERMLQAKKSEKEKKEPENVRTRRWRIDNRDEKQPSSRTMEENFKMMVEDLYCRQCHRTFKDKEEAESKKENKHHFCYTVGNLKTVLKLDANKTPTKTVSLTCTICPNGTRNVVFASKEELMKHMVLAHKSRFFIDQIEKKKNEQQLEDNLICVLKEKNCNHRAESLEDALIHLGVFHKKLFRALQHDKLNDYKHIARSLFPEEYSRSSHQWDRGSDGAAKAAKAKSDPGKAVKRRLEPDLDQAAGPSNKTPRVDPLVETPSAQKTEKLLKGDVPNTNSDLSPRAPSKTADVSSEPKPSTSQQSSIPTKQARNRMRQVECPVCGTLVSNRRTLLNHLAVEHFREEISQEYESTAEDKERHYPCPFPHCQHILMTDLNRIQHLGAVHNLSQKYLATPKVLEAAKLEVEKGKRSLEKDMPVVCKKCDTEFPCQATKNLHTCNSIMDQPPISRERRASREVQHQLFDEECNLAPQSGRKKVKTLTLPLNEIKDMKEGMSDASEDSTELNETVGDDDQEMDMWVGEKCEEGGCNKRNCTRCEHCGLNYHWGEHNHYPCEAHHCSLCFPSKELQVKHVAKFHTFADIY